MSDLADIIMVAVPVLIGVLIWKRERLLAGLTLVFNPITFILLLTFVSYFDGSGHLIGGSNRFMFVTIDREYRCKKYAAHGMHGGELLRTVTHTVLKTMIKTFGPMPGSYLGPYPDEQQAQQALKASLAIDPIEIGNGSITIGTTTYPLQPQLVAALLKHTGLFSPSLQERQAFEAINGPITAAIFQQDCLVIRVPTPDMVAGSAATYLIDLNTGEFIGYYTEGVY